MTTSRIPSRDNCDQADPRTAFKWAFVAWPFTKDQPFTPPSDLAEEWSQRLWDLGFRHDPDAQTKKIMPPHRGQQHPLNNTSYVVDKDEPDPAPMSIPNMEAHTVHEQAHVGEQLYRNGIWKRPEPEIDKASVAPTFNPGEHSPSTVHGYLMGQPEGERARVLALEMTGKCRDNILRKWKGQ